MKVSKFVIDGLFLTQRVTGIQRYAYELTLELDKIVPSGVVEIVVPKRAVLTVEYENIKVIKYGRLPGIPWQQIDFAHYVRKNNAECICLTNVIPLVYPKGFVTIHDVSYKANPQFFTSIRDRLSALWHRLNYWKAARSNMTIITVSEFSKREIEKYYKVSKERIKIIYNAWQHISRIAASVDIFERYPQLRKNNYYFSLSSLAANKNFKWLLYAAKNNPSEQFAIAGGGKLKGVAEASGLKDFPNIHFLGYVSDADAKALMAGCKAFIFPTLYEGFGIPPLEAVASGARRIVVSDTPCMHEIYGDCAEYLNAKDYVNAGINSNGKIDSADILTKYSWKESAEKLWLIMKSRH